MIFKSLSIYSALFSALATASADTVTQTNYIYPTNFLAVVDYILKDNPANVNSGIPIVFVYEDPSTRTPTAQIQPAVQTYGATDASPVQPQSQAPQSTFVTSSAFAYTTSLQSTSYNTFTTCTGNKCGITTQSTVVPHYYTTNTMVTYTTTGTNTPQLSTSVAPLSQTTPATKTTTPETTKLVSPSFSSVATSPALTSPPSTAVTSSGSTTAATSKKARSTIYDTEYVTQSSNINYIITATASTTTKVIFSDTTVPTTVFKPSTTVETISQTIRNPLGSNSAVSSSLTQSLTTDFSKDVTITSDPTSLKSSSATGSSSVGSGSSTSKSVSSGAKGSTSDSTDKTVSSGKTVATGTSSTATGTANTALSSASAITSLAGSETSGTTTASSGKTTPQGPFVSGNSSSSSATQSFTSTIDLRVTSGSPASSSSSVKYYNVSSPHSSTITSSGSISISSISTSSSASSGSSSSAVTSTSTESGSISSSGTSSSISATESSSSISSRSTSSSSGSSSISSSSASTSISSSSASASISSSSASTSASSETSSSISSSLSASSKSSSKASSSSTSSSSSATPSTTGAIEISAATDGVVSDLFSVIDTASPPSVFTREELPLSIPTGVDTSLPFGTNKFYANLFLGDQTDTIWPAPYGMFWKTTDYYGFGVTHTNASQRVYGSADTNNVGVDSYYLNPTGNAELIFSATSFASGEVSVLSVSDQQELSVLVTLSASSSDTTNVITMPVVNGMGFVTAIYSGSLVPELNSLIGVQTLTLETSTLLASNVLKYRATLYNGVEWLIYVTIPSDITTTFSLTASDGFHIVGTGAVNGLIIQVAYTDNTGESFYDESAGTYVTGATVTGSSSGDAAEYGFEYTSVGSSTPIVFAYPHQQDALSSATSATYTGLEVLSTTKGVMKGYYTKSLIMEETLIPAGFLPWTSTMTGSLTYTAEQLSLIASVANTELAVDIAATVQGADSNYFSGKIIDKYAYILLVVSDILQDEDVTKTTLASMKSAFTQFTENTQYYPLIYDTKFKGVTSSASQGGDTGADYGSGYYNDHHFHYGYFVHAAAIVGYVDNKLGGTWVEENKDWVNSLIRDVANPSTDDSYFPTSRMFDWFGGHSWAAGLFASGDGKNQESSSEDFNFSYGMRLWGSVIGDSAMQARGDLMLAVTSRAMNKYMYYKSDNTVEPEEILANKVSGIFFENKVAYTTYFGSPDTHPEYVHGIHMLPITPASSIVRIPSYVEEEWTDQVSTFIDDVDSGWTGILRLNQALYDADSSYSFFSSSSWSDTYLDDGQSRTWSLAFSGGVSNS